MAIPYNLYTLVVSEGIVRPYSELHLINRYEIENKVFVFDLVENKAITVNLDLQTKESKDGRDYVKK